MTYSQTIIIGNVGKDAELRFTPQGLAVANFNVAVNKVTGKGETRKEKTTWFKVTVWRDRAEIAAQYVKKGMKIMVVGEIDASAFIGQKDGKAMASLELTAQDFKFLSSPGEHGEASERSEQDDEDTSNDIPF